MPLKRITPQVAAVVVAFGSEPLLVPGVTALLSSHDVDIEVVVVDNGCTDDSIDVLRPMAGVTVIDPGRNLGFALGCAVGVEATDREYLVFVNPDAVAEADAVAHLVAALQDPSVGIATASIRLADHPDRLNSAGNTAHFLGFSWCVGYDELATEFAEPRDVACASGAGMAIRRDTWLALGGFVPEFFAYFEDSELSLRAWQQGLRVTYVPDAVVTHDYTENHTGPKLYLVERNRLIALLTLYERRTLVRLLGPIIATEARGGALRGNTRMGPSQGRRVVVDPAPLALDPRTTVHRANHPNDRRRYVHRCPRDPDHPQPRATAVDRDAARRSRGGVLEMGATIASTRRRRHFVAISTNSL